MQGLAACLISIALAAAPASGWQYSGGD